MRGFMVDSARALERPSYYRHFIDFIAERGMDTLLWHFTDDQGCAMQFESVDVPASANALTKQESRELAAYAQSRGIQLIPELASLGHTRYVTEVPAHADLAESAEWFSSMCPVSPRTRDLIARMLDEVIEVFDSPIIHVGLDEVNFGGHPLTKKALETQTTGQIFADYILFLHAHLAAQGRRLMMWGDYLLKLPEIADSIPKDILVANWKYDPSVKVDSAQQLTDHGFEVISCPALISYNQPIVPGESFAYPNVRKMTDYSRLNEKTTGILTTIWTPTRFLAESHWPAIDFAAAMMRESGPVDVQAQAEQFVRSYFGVEDRAHQFAEALAQQAAHAPLRKHWLPVLQCDRKHLLSDAALDANADRFEAMREQIATSAPSVTREQDRFQSLVLLADLLAHAWKRAVAVRDGTVDRALLDESLAMGKRLSDAWDTERYPDDSRKSQPKTEFDRGDSLLLMFSEGTEIIRGLAGEIIHGSVHNAANA